MDIILSFTVSQIKKLLIVLLLAIFSLPIIIFLPYEGSSDMRVWLEWASYIDRWGPLNAYSIINTHPDYERSDYPPVSFINIALALKASTVFNVSWMIGIKILILGYYLATWATLIYLSTLVKRRPKWRGAFISSLLFLGSFFFVVNSEARSYLDITYALWIVLSMALFLRQKYFLSGIFMALAILVKWIGILMIPAILFYFISKNRRRLKIDSHENSSRLSFSLLRANKSKVSPTARNFGRSLEINYLLMFKFFGGLALIFSLMIIAFLLNHLSLLSFVGSLSKAFGHGWSLTSGALNFYWLVDYMIKVMYPETFTEVIRNSINIFQLFSALIFASVVIAIIKSFIGKRRDVVSLLTTSLMISWSYFILRTGVHENHLFLSVLTALCIAIINTNWSNIRQYFWLSFFGLANLVIFNGITVNNVNFQIPQVLKGIWGINLTELIAALQVFVYLFYLFRYLRKND